MLNLYRRLYRKLSIRLKGLPVLVVIYKPWDKGKNIDFHCIAPFDDEYLTVRFKEIADHIRAEWQEKLEEVAEQALKGAEQ